MKIIRLLSALLIAVGTATASERPEEMRKLINVLIQVESGGNDSVIGDRHLVNKAYGCLQIRKPCVVDVNRKLGTNYQAEDCLGNRELSEKIFRTYIGIYATKSRLGREPTFEDMARIWNGGPRGFTRESTLPYWKKVEEFLR
jgi:hypothetical protein